MIIKKWTPCSARTEALFHFKPFYPELFPKGFWFLSFAMECMCKYLFRYKPFLHFLLQYFASSCKHAAPKFAFTFSFFTKSSFAHVVVFLSRPYLRQWLFQAQLSCSTRSWTVFSHKTGGSGSLCQWPASLWLCLHLPYTKHINRLGRLKETFSQISVQKMVLPVKESAEIVGSVLMWLTFH